MANHLRPPLALLLAVLGCALLLCCRRADATAFEVGGDDNGWVVPPSSDGGRYNQWASNTRFLVGDIVHFKYKEDSVMVVTEADYDSCSATHPIFFSNNGDTSVALDRPGPVYFISGEDGHCERGQRMVVSVVGQGAPPPPAPPSPPAPTGAAAAPAAGGALAGAIAAVAMALPVIVIGV